MQFEFFRFRFVFEALDAIAFPPGSAANTLRGAFGKLLQGSAADEAYTRFFEPASLAPGPSGLRDQPRPFVLRCSHLDGSGFAPGEVFFFGMHVFALRRPVWDEICVAWESWRRARLIRVEQLDLLDGGQPLGSPAASISLDPDPDGPKSVRLRFVTPTELKTVGAVAERPDFPVLFGRLRDRLCTLQSLYGKSPWDLDFRAMGERARQVQLTRCDLIWEYAARKSSRTKRTHPLGGFAGEVEYQGELGEFLPWLRAGRWVGVGRQTVWGKGEVQVLDPATALQRP